MFEKVKFWMILLIAFLFIVFVVPMQNILNFIIYEFAKKDDLAISLSLVNPKVSVLAQDPENKLVLRVEVRNSSGYPVPKANVVLSASNGLGEIYPSHARTDKYGEALVEYIPPSYDRRIFSKESVPVTITAGIYQSSKKSSVTISLSRAPVVMVHGYLADGSVFDNLTGYLSSKGFECSALTYNSRSSVASCAKELEAFLAEMRIHYLARGFQVKRFDIIAHSLGGLVARYYTSSKDYIKKGDVRKIIFVSVPQKGSPIAPIGVNYYKDQSVMELIPDSPLFTEIFPKMLNKGLNSTIQTASIIGQYDEVVSPASASLEDWNIETEMFFLGESTLNMNNLLNGNLMDAPIHKGILSNKKVFEKIQSMLETQLPYPDKKK